MKTVKLYTPAELKKKNPAGFERAHEWYKNNLDEVPWSGEIIDSLKATFKASDIYLRNYSIDAYGYSSVEFDMESDVEELEGQRAWAWLENNLLSDLREHRTFSNRVKKYDKWHDFTRYGEIPSCPFTGVCFDEDFIDSLKKSILDGDTLKEAYKNLADVTAKLFQDEIELAQSEEVFLAQDHLEFTLDGKHF